MGGVCNPRLAIPQVVFQVQHPVYSSDLHDGMNRGPYLRLVRGYRYCLAFCTLRLRCVAPNSQELFPPGTWPALEIQQSESDHPPTYDKNPVQTTGYHGMESEDGTGTILSILESNPMDKKPQCLNMLPRGLSPPFRRSDFQHGQELCALIYHRGLQLAMQVRFAYQSKDLATGGTD
jgi:hypothetical protein